MPEGAEVVGTRLLSLVAGSVLSIVRSITFATTKSDTYFSNDPNLLRLANHAETYIVHSLVGAVDHSEGRACVHYAVIPRPAANDNFVG
jgi:hypothetical protein